MTLELYSKNYATILETVRDYRFIDREQLTLLLADVYKEEGLRAALKKLVDEKAISANIRNAHHPRSEMGKARKRIVYYLAEHGRTYFNFTEQQRYRLSRKVTKLGGDQADLTHEVGISWFHCLGEFGKRKELFDFKWRAGVGTAIPKDDTWHTPDGVPTFNGYKRYLEYEHKNAYRRTREHFRAYWNAYRDEKIEGRVVFLTKTTQKLKNLMEDLRTECPEVPPEAYRLFMFLSQEMIDLMEPEKLLAPICLTLSGKTVPLVEPPRRT